MMYEADLRHTEIVVSQLEFEDANGVTTPGTREEGRTTQDQEEKLDENETTKFRAIVARLNYLSPDGPDVSYVGKELARSMASPSTGDWLRFKRVGRHLKDKPRLQQVFEWQPAQRTITTYSDVDWVGCRQTCKSTTGGCIVIGKHDIQGWSKTQSLVAPSSGESELYAALKFAPQMLGFMSMLKDLSWIMEGKVYGGASAALGIIHWTGLGKTRHIDTSLLLVTTDRRRETFHVLQGTWED